MKKYSRIFTVVLFLLGMSYSSFAQLSIQGVMDFFDGTGTPGKALQFKADSSISDLSRYSVGVANNGNGTDGMEFFFPSISVQQGDDILLYRDSLALASYFGSCISSFEVIIPGNNSMSQNGDDAIELFKDSVLFETFGDVNVDGTGTSWDYTDSWAFKDTSGMVWPNGWIYGGPNCTDNDTSVSTSSCPYPQCSNNSVHVVTFRVNTANINVGTNGMYLGKPGIAQAIAMSDPDGDGIWEGTDTLDGTAGGNFTFLNSPANNSNWATMENLTGLPCANPAMFNFRILPTFSQDTTLGFCFGTCSPNTVCPAAAATHVVTFKVNTANITVGPNGIYVGGGLYGSATGLALSDPDADGIWEGTDTLAGDGLGKFRFLNSPANSQNWATQENIAGLPCADPAAFSDRTLPVFSQDTTLGFCYGTCSPDTVCTAPAVPQSVHFMVDMNSPKAPSSFTQPYLSGSFNAWSGDAWPMTDTDGDNIWEYTAMLNANALISYKFSIDNWVAQEQFTVLDSACTQNTGGFINRFHTVGSAADTLAFCFNYCTPCASVGSNEDDKSIFEFSISPNPVNDLLKIDFANEGASVELLSTTGQQILNSTIVNGQCSLNTSNIPNGMYIVRLFSKGIVSEEKVVVNH
jgi:hypothetical protein